MATSSPSGIKTRFTNAKGESVVIYKDGTKTINGVSTTSLTPPPAARGDDFAENLNESAAQDGQTAEDLFNEYGSVTGASERSYGGTVMSNANIIERIIPLLDSRANSYNLTGDTGGTTDVGGDETKVEEDSFEEILGIKDKKKKKKEEELDPFTKQQMALIAQMERSNDAATRRAVNTIKNAYNKREAAQKMSNESGLATVRQALNLAGSSRYAPVSSQGIVSAAEAAGIRALSALDAEEQQIIGEVRAAQQDNDYQLLEEKLDLLDSVKAEKAKTTAQLQSDMQSGEEQMQIDDAIAMQISSGVTNPVQIYTELRNQGINVPLSTVVSSVESLGELTKTDGSGFKMDNKAIGQLLGKGWTTEDIKAFQGDLASGASITEILAGVDPEMQDAVLQALGVDKVSGPVKPGIGAADELTERAIRSQLEPKLMNILNKGAVSDEDRKYVKSEIAFYRDNGLSPQQILDIFSGWSQDVNTPYNDSFRDVILANDQDGTGVSPTLTRVGSLLSNKNYKAAMDAVESLAFTQAKKLDPDGFIGTATSQNYLKKGQELTKLAKDAESLIGPLEGTWEQVKGRLAKSKDPKAANISAKIAALVAQMRNDLSGTAVTESEAQFLEPLIPSLSDTMENFLVKIRALNDNVLSQHNSVRSSVSLPTVSVEQIIDPKKRVSVYSTDVYSRNANALDI